MHSVGRLYPEDEGTNDAAVLAVITNDAALLAVVTNDAALLAVINDAAVLVVVINDAAVLAVNSLLSRTPVLLSPPAVTTQLLFCCLLL